MHTYSSPLVMLMHVMCAYPTPDSPPPCRNCSGGELVIAMHDPGMSQGLDCIMMATINLDYGNLHCDNLKIYCSCTGVEAAEHG